MTGTIPLTEWVVTDHQETEFPEWGSCFLCHSRCDGRETPGRSRYVQYRSNTSVYQSGSRLLVLSIDDIAWNVGSSSSAVSVA